MAEILDKETIKALSAESRQKIVKMLAKRPYTASEIAKVTDKHVTTVTEHLDMLESSGLIRKKETTNKWIYYELTQKGGYLFKPSHSWVVVLSLSVVFMFTGLLRLVRLDVEASAGTYAPMMTQKTAEAVSAGVTTVDYIGYTLIILGLAGLAFLAYRQLK